MATLITDGMEVDVTVAGVDKEGNVSPIDAASPVTGVSSDESIATVVPGPDNATVTVRTSGPGQPIGPFSITITGDGDPGDGVRHISVVHEFENIAGPADSLTTTVGEARPRVDG